MACAELFVELLLGWWDLEAHIVTVSSTSVRHGKSLWLRVTALLSSFVDH
jgi:hypothetical protein